MSTIGGSSFKLGENLLSELKNMGMRDSALGKDFEKPKTEQGPSFLDHLKDGVKEVNELNESADKLSMELANGKQENIHETMLRMSEAELGFNLMVQVRNKILDAYQEVMRMPV